MARTTKIGLWLVPWFPVIVVGVFVLGQFQPWYWASETLAINADGSTWTTAHGPLLPLPLIYHPQLFGVAFWLSVAASLVGCVLLLRALFGKLIVKPPL